jgi:hypothetical protein
MSSADLGEFFIPRIWFLWWVIAGCRHTDMLLLFSYSFDGYGMRNDIQNMIILSLYAEITVTI